MNDITGDHYACFTLRGTLTKVQACKSYVVLGLQCQHPTAPDSPKRYKVFFKGGTPLEDFRGHIGEEVKIKGWVGFYRHPKQGWTPQLRVIGGQEGHGVFYVKA